jgi:hypothetical protein
MLRRTTPRSVTVFVALKVACDVELFIHLTPDPQSYLVCPRPEHAILPTRTRALGQHLHVLCITATLPSSVSNLDPDWIYGYDMRFTPIAGGQAETLSSQGLLEGAYALGYADGVLPSFATLPAALKDLNLVHGSCRKPHGQGRDMLAVLDDFIAQDREHIHLRPHQLFLTGDQIYADDVNLCLLRTLTETGKMLLGWNEVMRDAYGIVEFGLTDAWDGPNWRRGGHRRAAFVGESGAVGYTSGERDGHLMFLAEFIAMYLMAWSEVLWPRDASAQPGQTAYALPLFADSVKATDWQGVLTTAGFADDVLKPTVAGREAALVYASTLPKVRRALANVPTYMMFDDHEVTDDWNLNWTWVKNVRGRYAGRRLLRNGLLSYAVFQDWGNQPESYETGFGKLILDNLTYDSAGGTAPAVETDPENDALFQALDLRPLPPNLLPHAYTPQMPDPASRKRWDYVVDGPQHRVIVLDSRTWRSFPTTLPGQKENGPSALIAHHILPLQLKRRSDPDCLHIVVAPAPVLGIPVVEEVVQRIYANVSTPEAADMEAWGADRETFELLLAKMAELGRVIILSGDVHYAFSNQTAYFREQPGGVRARFVQLCASAFKNEDDKTRAIGLGGHLLTPDTPVGWLGFEGDQYALLQVARAGFSKPDAWEYVRVTTLPKAAQLTLKSWARHYYFNVVYADRFGPPAVLPSEGWKIDEFVEELQQVAPQSDWRYAITYLRDNREKSVRQKQRFGVKLERILEPARSIVGFNNIGRISFNDSAPGQAVLSVTHRLYWYIHEGLLRSYFLHVDASLPNELWYTEHVAPLTLPTDDERPEVAP